MLSWLPLFSLLLLTACNPFVPAPTEHPQLPENYRHASRPAVTQLPERWWQTFGDRQLNRLQQEMLTGNLDLLQSLHRLEQLEALRKASGASLWPSLSLNASVSREQSPAATGSSTTDNLRTSLAAGYEVDLWNRLHDKEQAAELRLQAGKRDAQTLLLSLTAQLAENYFQALEARGQIALIEQQIERNQQLLATVTDRYRAGLATSEELYRARNNLSGLRARLPQLQTALNQNEQGIALLLGRQFGQELTTGTSLPQLSSMVDIGLPASLLQNRPDIAAAMLQLQAADRELAAALADRLPTVKLTASLGHSVATLASGDIDGSFWTLAASLAQPLIDGGRRQAEVDRQQASRSEQLAKVQQILLKAVQEVESALIAEQNNAQRSSQLDQQRRSSARTLALNRDNYRSGLTSSSTLLSAEIEHLTILSQQLSSQREWLSSRITLARALGGQWMSTELSKQQQARKKTEDNRL